MIFVITAIIILPVLCAIGVFILEYALEVYEEMGRMTGRDGGMRYNDKSDPWYVGHGDR